ncbi:MAG: geranylgeranylglyceryl/heptaprenylglyceryl phosphate synthase, partial [Bacteroidetes bacterium]|nr:geranylgeranylglyceryl/heptaprenylglyceryl phosphate synthase [Bacteroidota bacterium]
LQSKKENRKNFAVLVDPDKVSAGQCEKIAGDAHAAGVDLFFVGSSLLTGSNISNCIHVLKKNCNIPVVLFPGSTMQISSEADAILLLSLISGRNAEMLIGKQVTSAPLLRSSNLEIISTGYMLIDPGHPTSVSYMSNTTPIPYDKNDIALCTALAGEQLGMKIIFMDAGSGARVPVSKSMTEAVSKTVSVPLITGGGIKTPEKAIENCHAGADVIVVGNSIEKDHSLIAEMADAIHSVQTT